MDWITAPLIMAIIFGTIYKLAELFVRKRERLLLINKLTEISNVDFRGISLYSSGNKFTALRIGVALLGLVAIVIFCGATLRQLFLGVVHQPQSLALVLPTLFCLTFFALLNHLLAKHY